MKTDPAGGKHNEQGNKNQGHEIKGFNPVFLGFELPVPLYIGSDIADFLGIILGQVFSRRYQ